MNGLQELKWGFISFSIISMLCAVLFIFLGGVELIMLLCASVICVSVYFAGYCILKKITELS